MPHPGPTPPGPDPSRRADRARAGRLPSLQTLALGILVGASYAPALGAGFVWDDVIFTEEPVVHAWSGLWNIWFSPADIANEGHYWPVVYTSFWLEHKLWGLAPLGYHAVNILLHLVNVLLVWRLLHRLAAPGAWVVAAVFAVHPLHVESVAWVIERKDPALGVLLPDGRSDLDPVRGGAAPGTLRAGSRPVRGRPAVQVDRGHPACGARRLALVAVGSGDADRPRSAGPVLRGGADRHRLRLGVLHVAGGRSRSVTRSWSAA